MHNYKSYNNKELLYKSKYNSKKKKKEKKCKLILIS